MKFSLSLFAMIHTASAFNMQAMPFSRNMELKSTHSEMEVFERAVECAEHFGVCDIEQMEYLAKELEEFNGVYFESVDESNAAMMQKEVADRKDVADILKMQGELRLRMDYLDGANLFAQDVHDMTDALPETN
jgi:CRISPR/Cas system Type II protein with McrA/HNH and RuvC-like nuclease domain